MSDSTETILNELHDTLEDWTGLQLEVTVLAVIFEDSHTLYEAMEWGTHDTVVREGAMDHLARELAGTPWPIGRDNWTDEQMIELNLKIQTAHDQIFNSLPAVEVKE